MHKLVGHTLRCLVHYLKNTDNTKVIYSYQTNEYMLQLNHVRIVYNATDNIFTFYELHTRDWCSASNKDHVVLDIETKEDIESLLINAGYTVRGWKKNMRKNAPDADEEEQG